MRVRGFFIGLMVFGFGMSALAQESPAYRIETVVEGLDYPWSLAFLTNGDMLVTERDGQLRLIKDGVLVDKEIRGLPDDIYVGGQAGLFDVVPDPNFATNHIVYISYAHGSRRANGTRVIRAIFDGVALSDVTTIFTASPDKATSAHFGGRILPMADGTLLITLGEGFQYREEAQNTGTHLGTIVRINTDGTVPADNPFVGVEDAKPEVYSYGHRNVQGITMDTATGRVYAHEHGARGGDEVNLIAPSLNYGWPAITYGIDYSGAEITPYTELPGMEQPLLYWVPSIAPSGLAFYDGDLFPAWKGSLFAGALAGMKVQRVMLQDGQVVGEEVLFREVGARIRDVRTGPDGAIYLLTDDSDGKLLRIVPE